MTGASASENSFPSAMPLQDHFVTQPQVVMGSVRHTGRWRVEAERDSAD